MKTKFIKCASAACQKPVQLITLTINPAGGKVSLASSVQGESGATSPWVNSPRFAGIQRGRCGPDGNQRPDHSIDDVVDVHIVGRAPAYGAAAIRKSWPTNEDHEKVILAKNPGKRVLAVFGNGDFGNNRGFWNFDGERVHCVQTDVPSFQINRKHLALVARKSGQASIEPVSLGGDASPRLLDASGADITTEVAFAQAGLPVVMNGEPLSEEFIAGMIEDGAVDDLRHALRFGGVPCAVGSKDCLDVGLQHFWKDGKIDGKTARHAYEGAKMTIDVGSYGDPKAIANALEANKGYKLVNQSPEIRGQYRLPETLLEIRYLRGIYPHSFLAQLPDGTLMWVGIRGLSNRTGVTLYGAGHLLASLGAVQAVIIDNGGDVFLSFEGQVVLASSEGRTQQRAMLGLIADEASEVTYDDCHVTLLPSVIPEVDDA